MIEIIRSERLNFYYFLTGQTLLVQARTNYLLSDTLILEGTAELRIEDTGFLTILN